VLIFLRIYSVKVVMIKVRKNDVSFTHEHGVECMYVLSKVIVYIQLSSTRHDT